MPNSIIIFGEPNLGLEIANWVAETNTDETIEIVLATSGPQDTSVYAHLNKKIGSFQAPTKKLQKVTG